MEKDNVRKVVREILSEIGSGWDSNNDVSQFYGSGQNQFPYLYVDKPDMLPGVDELKNQDVDSFDDFRKNDEVYQFPYEDFKVGMEKEVESCKRENKNIHLYDIARFVIDNLQQDKNYYKSKDVNNNQENSQNRKKVN